MRKLTEWGDLFAPLLFLQKKGGLLALDIKFYEIDEEYIDYMCQFDKHLFHNKQAHQTNKRKYIGILFKVDNLDYFVPLSSFKPKHADMKETIDFIKLGDYAVVNLCSMLPVTKNCCRYVDFSEIEDKKYRSLLVAEYVEIKNRKDLILKNAKIVYSHKLHKGNDTSLARRCADFKMLEQKALEYSPQK